MQRGEELLEAHQRVRLATKTRNVRYRVEAQCRVFLLIFQLNERTIEKDA